MAGLTQIAEFLGIPSKYIFVFVIAQIWSLAWKGVAWWKSARKNHLIWFVLFFLVHTFGILEILYIFWLSKIKLGKKVVVKARKRR